MSDNSINLINNNAQPAAVTSVLLKAQVKAPVTMPVEETSDQDKSSKPVQAESEQLDSSANISVNFRINDDNELTVFIVDRSSKRVLRSIPASEFYKLQAGDLLKLTA